LGAALPGRYAAAGTVNRGDQRQISDDHRALGSAVRNLREAAGLSQEQLAARCGLHRTYVGGIERGERNVSFTNLLKLARALSVKPSRLLADAESLTPTHSGDDARER
jgi:transcriptional regulator with XRE-family HTH domain